MLYKSLILLPIVLCALPFQHSYAPSLLAEGVASRDTYPVSLRLGVEAYRCFNGRVRFLEKFQKSYFHPKLKILSFSPEVVFNVKERLDVFGKVGMGECFFSYFSEDSRYKIEMKRGLLYQGGARLLLFEIKDIAVGMMGHYGYAKAKGRHGEVNDRPLDVSHTELYLRTWEVGLGLSWSLPMLTPYAGFNIHDVRLHLQEFPNENMLRLRQRHRGGMMLGVAISSKTLFVAAELRLINEQSAEAALSLRF